LKKIASRAEFLKVIEGTNSVGELINEFRNRFALKKSIKEEQKVKLMVGRTFYKLPDTTTYRKNMQLRQSSERKQLVE